MAYNDLLSRKINEIAHNEILAFLTVILGMVTLIGGLLVTILVVETPKWLLILPYQPPTTPPTILGLILTLTGFILLSIGFISVIYYDRQRLWATSKLEKFGHTTDKEDILEPIRKALEKHTEKR